MKKYFPDNAVEMALSGGEDYELLFTGDHGTVDKVKSQLKIPVHIIGEITAGEPGKIKLRDASGKSVEIKRTGWTALLEKELSGYGKYQECPERLVSLAGFRGRPPGTFLSVKGSGIKFTSLYNYSETFYGSNTKSNVKY